MKKRKMPVLPEVRQDYKAQTIVKAVKKVNHGGVVALVPAHNEQAQIGQTLCSLLEQSIRPQLVIVILDNCSDDTEQVVQSYGVARAGTEVIQFKTVGNNNKKAGALNQALDLILPVINENISILVMDADSILEQRFIENGIRRLSEGYAACGGVFTGKSGGSFLGFCQRNEFVRYKRDVRRLNGRTLVLTGTATIFKVSTLKSVVNGRLKGSIPCGMDSAHVYDTCALTEDNELTFAILRLNEKIIAPEECGLITDVMIKWRDLFFQRLRWKRGFYENLFQYGLNFQTAKYWYLAVMGVLSVVITVVYLMTVLAGIITGFRIRTLWIIVTIIFALEQVVTVRERGKMAQFVAAFILPEMLYDLFLQCATATGIIQSLLRTKKKW